MMRHQLGNTIFFRMYRRIDERELWGQAHLVIDEVANVVMARVADRIYASLVQRKWGKV